eukprot:1721957-Prymnesium_polylepis.1
MRELLDNILVAAQAEVARRCRGVDMQTATRLPSKDAGVVRVRSQHDPFVLREELTYHKAQATLNSIESGHNGGVGHCTIKAVGAQLRVVRAALRSCSRLEQCEELISRDSRCDRRQAPSVFRRHGSSKQPRNTMFSHSHYHPCLSTLSEAAKRRAARKRACLRHAARVARVRTYDVNSLAYCTRRTRATIRPRAPYWEAR